MVIYSEYFHASATALHQPSLSTPISRADRSYYSSLNKSTRANGGYRILIIMRQMEVTREPHLGAPNMDQSPKNNVRQRYRAFRFPSKILTLIWGLDFTVRMNKFLFSRLEQWFIHAQLERRGRKPNQQVVGLKNALSLKQISIVQKTYPLITWTFCNTRRFEPVIGAWENTSIFHPSSAGWSSTVRTNHSSCASSA